MKSVISIGNQDFISIRENHCFYIDKTDILRNTAVLLALEKVNRDRKRAKNTVPIGKETQNQSTKTNFTQRFHHRRGFCRPLSASHQGCGDSVSV